MDPTLLAQWQFGITTVYHYFFVPLTIGLTTMTALMQTLWFLNGQDVYKQMTKFWGKLMLINFAMGVVTGIVQEFQFGMNWSEYSRFVGDIFGAPLAIEALLAFFMESTFLGLWLFGWDRVSKRAHLASIWLVAIGSLLSSVWILIANAFMQNPVGYELRNGRAEMTDFLALLFNPSVQVAFPHVIGGAFTTAGFFVMGISAWHLLRKSHVDLFKRSFQLGAIVGLIAIGLTVLNGHEQARHMIASQPMKMAAAEGLYVTEDPASFSVLTIGDFEGNEVFSFRIPTLLSLLSYNQLTGVVRGMDDLQVEYEARFGPGDYRPPAFVVYWSFRAMVGSGFAMLGLAVVALVISLGDLTEKAGRWLALYPLAILLPYVANSTGWLMTEVGRSPWVVHGLMKIEDAVSPNVSGEAVLFTTIVFTLLYGALMAADLYLLRRFAATPELAFGPLDAHAAPDLPAPSLVGTD
ncbi:MAG TPA: cytochrome ubiquinol oxidase subunit I [Anaerolineales bacterium]|nr:cytochrome ubiquinol oxidase subunit I [Anaerolineales bacterium]